MEKIDLRHTPGEWKISPTCGGDWRDVSTVPASDRFESFKTQTAMIKDANGDIICEVKAFETDGFIKPSSGQYEANALLIAAAPLLLSALIKAVEDMEDMKDLADHQYPDNGPHELPVWCAEAKAAIAKATNTTQP